MKIPHNLSDEIWYEQCEACYQWYPFIEDMIWEPSDNTYWCRQCYPVSKYW